MVAWYATEGADLDNELWGASPGQQSPNYSRDLLTAGINSVRGAAAETIAQLIFDDASHLAFFEPYLRAMVNDRSVAVRTLVAQVLLSILRHNRDLAVELFLVLCQADGRLLATHYVEMFLAYTGQTHFQQLEPVLSRMVESQVEDVARAGARQVCLAALEIEDALPLADRCFAGSKFLKLGATEVYSANLKQSAFRAKCEEMLGSAFTDLDDEVRRAAAMCFSQFEGQELGDYRDLIEAYIKSPAFTPDQNYLISALGETTANMPDIILATCERFLDWAGDDAEENRMRASVHSGDIATLIVRVYSRATDPLIKHRCLDHIDRMELLMLVGLDKVTDEFER